jgi:hypothetical protein
MDMAMNDVVTHVDAHDACRSPCARQGTPSMAQLIRAETHATGDGVRQTLEVYREEHGWRLRTTRNDREVGDTRTSKWQRVESAFQIFRLSR